VTKGTDLDGKSVISHHLDWAALPVIINNFIVAFHIPSEKDEQPWVNIGFAGLMSSVSALYHRLVLHPKCDHQPIAIPWPALREHKYSLVRASTGCWFLQLPIRLPCRVC